MNKKKIQTRRVLSLKERIEVIKIAEVHRDTKELARQFDCGRTQILSILQQRESLLREWANNGDPNRLRRRPSAYAVAINKIVAEWIYRCRSQQKPLTDHMIMEKAFQAKKLFGYTEFRPNRRWLDRFKRCFRLDDVNMEIPDPSCSDGTEKSVKLRDIFNDIKDSLDTTIVIAMSKSGKFPVTEKFVSKAQRNVDCSYVTVSMESSVEDHAVSLNKEISEDDDESIWLPESFCETDIVDESANAIRNDQQALECIERLQEYSLLKENFRAIGIIMQLEQLYKGQLEA